MDWAIPTAIQAARSNVRWGTDWTCFWTADRWLWLVPIVDHWDRDIPGWSIVEHPTAQAAVDALEMAVVERESEYFGDVEVRSDGGPQFTAHRYARAIARLGLRHTVTPARSPDYNPFAEAFIAAFKEESVYQSHWTSHEQAVREVEAWIHKYRSRREQAALGGLVLLGQDKGQTLPKEAISMMGFREEDRPGCSSPAKDSLPATELRMD